MVNLYEKSSTSMVVSGIGLLILFVGLYMVYKTKMINENLIEIQALVTGESNCTQVSSGNSSYTSCSVPINYVVNSIRYTTTITSSTSYPIGDKVNVYYNKSNPSEMQQHLASYTGPIILSVVGLFMLIGGLSIK